MGDLHRSGWLLLCAFTPALAGCATTKPGAPDGQRAVPEPVEVRIGPNCAIAPDQKVVNLDYKPHGPGAYPAEVEWIVDKSPGEFAVFSSKSAEDQDKDNRLRGWEIKTLLPDRYLHEENKVFSGTPGHKPPFKKDAKTGHDVGVEWRYNIEIFNADGTRKCFVDPGLCYRTPDGGAICH
jgi:hypothetical protein